MIIQDDSRVSALMNEIEKLHYRYELSQTVGEDYYEPGMMEYLNCSEGLYDPESGRITIRFEVKGTRYEGRTERIETVHINDPVQVKRDAENTFNPNNFEITDAKGKSLGNMPASLCNAIAPLYDENLLQIENAFVSFTDPISKRSRHAKQAVLFAEVHLNLQV